MGHWVLSPTIRILWLVVLKASKRFKSCRMGAPFPSCLHQNSLTSVNNAVSIVFPGLKPVEKGSTYLFFQYSLDMLFNQLLNNLHRKMKFGDDGNWSSDGFLNLPFSATWGYLSLFYNPKASTANFLFSMTNTTAPRDWRWIH